MEDGAKADGARKPTLKTISLATGLAVPTVSRALAGAADLSADTKALVARVAAEMGYVPNRAGVRLRTGRTNVIALVMPTEHDMMNNTARLIASLAAGLRGTAFHLNVTPFFPDDDPLRPIRYLVETGAADAVVFNQTLPHDPRAAWLMERRFPFATHGRTDWAASHPWADFDNAAFAAIAVRGLARRGRGRVALVAPPQAQNYGQDFRRGGAEAARAAGVAVEALDVDSDAPASAIRAAVGAALGGVDGIVCASTVAAMAAVAAIEDRGRAVGRDVDLVGKEAIPFLRLFRPGILAVREDVGRAGAVLARAAIRAIREPNAAPIQDLEVPSDPWEDGTA